jgi:hypothetical protein
MFRRRYRPGTLDFALESGKAYMRVARVPISANLGKMGRKNLRIEERFIYPILRAFRAKFSL